MYFLFFAVRPSFSLWFFTFLFQSPLRSSLSVVNLACFLWNCCTNWRFPKKKAQRPGSSQGFRRLISIAASQVRHWLAELSGYVPTSSAGFDTSTWLLEAKVANFAEAVPDGFSSCFAARSAIGERQARSQETWARWQSFPPPLFALGAVRLPRLLFGDTILPAPAKENLLGSAIH